MPLSPDLVSKCISGLWLLFLIYWVIHAFGNKRSTFKQSRSSRLLYLVITSSLVYTIVSIRQLHVPLMRTTTATQLAGIVLCATGIGIAIWARRVLGTNWSGIVTLKEGHTLVRRGPYACCRHPIYSGILLAAFGSFLAVLPTLQGVICLCFLFVGFRLKSLLEERVLSQQFPDEYPRYRREVKALVPYIYSRNWTVVGTGRARRARLPPSRGSLESRLRRSLAFPDGVTCDCPALSRC